MFSFYNCWYGNSSTSFYGDYAATHSSASIAQFKQAFSSYMCYTEIITAICNCNWHKNVTHSTSKHIFFTPWCVKQFVMTE